MPAAVCPGVRIGLAREHDDDERRRRLHGEVVVELEEEERHHDDGADERDDHARRAADGPGRIARRQPAHRGGCGLAVGRAAMRKEGEARGAKEPADAVRARKACTKGRIRVPRPCSTLRKFLQQIFQIFAKVQDDFFH